MQRYTQSEAWSELLAFVSHKGEMNVTRKVQQNTTFRLLVIIDQSEKVPIWTSTTNFECVSFAPSREPLGVKTLKFGTDY